MNKTLTTIVLGTTLAYTGCGEYQTRGAEAQRAQEVPKIVHYIERENIAHRQKIFDDPNTISFVYGLSDMGNVLFMDVAKGKVSSSTKRLEPIRATGTADARAGISYNTGEGRIYTDEIMQADGTFGSSDPYVFWFTPEGTYRQWNGKYLTSSVPIKLKSPILNFSDVDRDLESRAKGAYDALAKGKKVYDNLEVQK